jgi:hypothetical protein
MEEFVADNLAYYAETQGVLPERLTAFGERYRSQGYLTRDQLYDIAYEFSTRSAYVRMIEPIREIAAETGYDAVDVGYALFAYDDRVREGTLQ